MAYKDPNDPRILQRRGKRPLEDKTCSVCRRTFLGRYPTKYCSADCSKKAAQAKAPDYNLTARRKSRANDPRRFLIYRVKNRAKSQGIFFDLRPEDLTIPEKCPVLGIALRWNLGIGRMGYHPNSFSVDRKNPDLGYIAGNVRVISARANLLKNNATVEEISLVLEDLKQLSAEKKQ